MKKEAQLIVIAGARGFSEIWEPGHRVLGTETGHYLGWTGLLNGERERLPDYLNDTNAAITLCSHPADTMAEAICGGFLRVVGKWEEEA